MIPRADHRCTSILVVPPVIRRLVVPILAAMAGFTLAKGISGPRSGSAGVNRELAETRSTGTGTLPARIRATPLGAAIRTVEAIDAMTLEDFQAIANDPSKFPKLDEALSDWEYNFAFVDALVSRWPVSYTHLTLPTILRV